MEFISEIEVIRDLLIVQATSERMRARDVHEEKDHVQICG